MANVLTVSQFVESIRGLLRETVGVVTVQGEVTNYRSRRDDLLYFELKDERSRVLCFGLRHELRMTLEDGLEVQVTGWPSLFLKNGGFHLRVVDIQLVGEGTLRKQFELTKKRLETEGLFRPERKRPLPQFPDMVGLVTSPDAAAYTDVLRILRNRWPIVRVKLAGVSVQGAGSARQIVRGLEHFSSTRDADVVILTRGGGSLEDLQAFNDEGVARAIFASRVPVVVGVGHERDVTIADYVADVRASTPSNAAERVVPDRSEVLNRIDVMSARIARSLASAIEAERVRVAEFADRLATSVARKTDRFNVLVRSLLNAAAVVQQRVAVHGAELRHLSAKLRRATTERMAAGHEGTENLSQLLRSLSPLAILKRGYSITTKRDGAIVKAGSSLKVGESIHTQFGSGAADSSVTEVA